MDAERSTSLGRGLHLLLALGSDEARLRGGLGVVEIAKIVGREKSQVSRALKTLADHDFVERDPDSLDYRLGWRLFALAGKAGHRGLLTVSAPVLRELVAKLGETVHVSVLDGAEVVTVLSEASPSTVRASEWSGRSVPAHCTSSGRALLFDHDRDALAAVFPDGALSCAGPHAPRDIDDLHRRVVAARVKGHAATFEELEPGLVATAAPIRDFRGRIIAALNVSAPKFRFEDRLEPAGVEIERAAGELSLRLGWFSERRPRSLENGAFPTDGRRAALTGRSEA
jgi:IclR family KDG regulon transcriptional repressor